MSSIIQPQRRNSKDVPPRMASRHDATLMNPGPPALYQLNTERKYIDENQKKVKRWIYGRRDRNKQNKVILLVGETGAGKTTMINTMINYFLGVKFEDEEFYQITEEDDDIEESLTQTSEITVYEVFVEENPTSLTIIDTPGYANTEGYEKDGEISEYLIRLFSDEDGIHYIDAVCFVMKAFQNRLSGKEHYIFHSVLSLLGRDIENNIVFLLTHTDGRQPRDAISAIKKAQIPCRRDGKKQPIHFLFNNQQKEKRDKLCESVLKLALEMGQESMTEFFTLLEEKNRKSVQMTLDVLKERRRLKACVSNLKEQISESELKMKELTEIQEAIKEQRDKIEKCEHFQFTVKTAVKEKVTTDDEWWWSRNQTCCNVCEENCHKKCWEDPQSCEVMKKKHCTVCTGKCHYSDHVRENKKYVVKPKTITMTFHELKLEYERTEKNLISDLETIKKEKSKLLREAYMTIVTLSEIALKADSAFTLQHLDFLIPRLKEEGEKEWMKNLEDLRKAGEEQKNKGALHLVMNFTGKKMNQFDNRATAATASSVHHHQRKTIDEPPEIIAGVIRLKDEFIELYERDHSQLQQCTERLCHIIKTFEKGYRWATEYSTFAGWTGIGAGAALVAGLALAPFTLGAFFAAVVLLILFSLWILINARFMSMSSSSDKRRQITQLRKGIESECKEFQDKITPMAEKMKDIHERTEKILGEQDVIRIEDVAELTKQMSETMLSIAAVHGGFSLVFNMFTAGNSRTLNDMDILAETPTDEEIDESEMNSEAGKFIVKMRKLINQLQNILDELEKTKDKLAVY
ncbi:Septin-4 [Labeo rohita]|uniref:Septin-4 n=1 Tax=Labeo rohita TaxID=84645 RepID=A0ABQ8ML31_LABRO|nr:Septin-4 [Labeo rohita]